MNHYHLFEVIKGIPVDFHTCRTLSEANLTVYAKAGLPFREHSNHTGCSIVRGTKGTFGVICIAHGEACSCRKQKEKPA